MGIFKLNVQNIKICILSNYCADYNQILHSHKDHQILFVGGPTRTRLQTCSHRIGGPTNMAATKCINSYNAGY